MQHIHDVKSSFMQNIPQKSKQGDNIMTHTKANKSKILMLVLGLTMCLALMLGIVFASPTSTVYAEGETLTPYDIIT